MRTPSLLLPLALLACAPACSSNRPGLSPCGTGTRDESGTCVGTLSCGTGTTLQGGACVATGGGGLTCGTGTTESNGQCVASGGGGGGFTCGSGTIESGTTCIAADGITCGAGTTLNGTTCVSLAGGYDCGAGTTVSGTECVASGTNLSCGAGTVRSGDQCVPAGGATTSINTFVSANPPGYWIDRGPNYYEYQSLFTPLDGDQAGAYLKVDATLIGGPYDGLFIYVGGGTSPDPAPQLPSTVTYAIRAPGNCTLDLLRTLPATRTDANVGFVRDFGGTKHAVCADGGTVTLGFDQVSGKLRYRLTTRFSDGTTLSGAEVFATHVN